MTRPTTPAPDAASDDVRAPHDPDLFARLYAASNHSGDTTTLPTGDVRGVVHAMQATDERIAHLESDLARLRAPAADLAATFPGATARPWTQFILRLPTVGAAPVVARPTALVFGPGDVPVCDTCDRGSLEYRGGPATVAEVANAALIVAAVNAHGGLVAENARLLALVAADRERHAAEVAGARAAALREAEDACRAEAARWESDARAGGVLASERRATARELADAVAALATKGAPDV